MSTILDALRRAEQERQRGTVPGVHSGVPLAVGPLPGGAPALARRWPWALALIVGLALCAGLAWWWLHQGAGPTRVAVSSPLVSAVPPAPPSAPLSAPPSAPPSAPLSGADSKAAATAPVSRPAAASAVPRPVAKAPPVARLAAEPAPARRAVAAPAPTAVAPPRQPASAGAVFAPEDLPASVRAELPSLHLAGITWSGNPRLRMAIVNGQVLHEGDAAAPGLVLAAIEPGRTVWTFRGYRVALVSQ